MKRTLLIVGSLALAGCGMQRQNVHVQVPAMHVNPASGPTIVVSAVTDSRHAWADAGLDAAEQARNVGGVIRGGNGIAVNLDGGSVADQSRQIVVQALRGIGYKIVDNGDAEVPRIAVNVTKFEVNMPFNFWRAASYSQKMYADVTAKMSVTKNGSTRSFVIAGHGENVYQRVVEENWETALNRAIADFTQKLQAKMSASE